MYRSFALALGVFLVILGLECLVVDQATLTLQKSPPPTTLNWMPGANAPQAHEIDVPDWAPWSFISSGAVIIIYSFTLLKRFANAQG